MSGTVIGSLFSGYGGLDMAVAAVLGGRVAWHCEWDDNPSKILAHRWPSIPNHRDITKVQWTPHCPDCGELVALYDRSGDGFGGRFYYCATCATEKPLSIRDAEPWVPEPVDVLTGGFPCQDVSHAGRRAGLIRDGEGRTRSGLWGEMLKAIDTLRPRLVVAENVRGLLSATADSDVEPCTFCMGDGGGSPMRALGAVLADLADVGYDAAWVGLPASGVGAPHGRFRVFILAWPRDAAPDADNGRRWELDAQLGRVSVAHEDSDRPVTLLPTPAVNDMGRAYTPEEWDAWTERMKAAHGNGNGHGASLHVEALRMLPTPQAHDSVDGKTAEQVAAMRERTGAGVWNLNEVAANELSAVTQLLPTPNTGDANGARLHKGGNPTIVGVIEGTRPQDEARTGTRLAPLGAEGKLLPTPVTTDANGSGSAADATYRGTSLTDATVRQADTFGDYAPAIARWEHVLGRPAPAPTEPTGKGGAHRLSPRFVEWMMGLPASHVTDVPDLTRNAQLKALGNGVVPQQAAAALEWLLRMRATYATTGG